MISHTRQGVRCVTGLGFCVLRYHTRDNWYDIYYGYWVLRLVITHTRQGVRFVTGIGLCVLRYHTRDRGYDLLRALGSASCDITDETGGTVSYGHWVLRLVISLLRQGGTICSTGIGFCVFRYHIRDRGYDLLRALGCVSLRYHTRDKGVRFVTGIGFCLL